jgi:hypothetical protein
MKQTFSNSIEIRRELDGPLASKEGDRNGRFVYVTGPQGTRLTIIISDSSGWEEVFGPGTKGQAWEHVSVTTPTRCPSWVEMCWVKDQFFDDHEVVLQFHPAKSNYVNDHPFCLHLWKPVFPFPVPPTMCV